MNWNTQRVLITGASRGLGAALAEALAGRGAKLALVARHEGSLSEVIGRIKAKGGTAFPIVADVGEKEATHRISGQAAAVLGQVDLLIHNASTLGPVPLRPLLDTECESLAAVLETNLVGPFRLTKAVLGPMVLRRSGTILFVSSDAAVEGYPGWGSYGVSKAAADQLARVLAAEVKEAGVRVLSVDPGEMDTQMHRDAIPEADPSTLARPEVVAERTGRPAGRSGARSFGSTGARSELGPLMTALELVPSLTEVTASRLLVMDERPRVLSFTELPSLLGPGDVLVLNEAATFPGSIHFQRRGVMLEARLFEKTARGFKAVLFGPGDFRTRTEHRAPPPRLNEGERLSVAGLSAEVASVDPRSHRLVELHFEVDDATQWGALYRHGRPIQYAHQREPLPLWAVQNVYAERPWAAELPSAGHHLTFSLLAEAAQRGAVVTRLTHATGLSSTGDDALDRSLPWPERYSIPAATLEAVQQAKRVVAVGTSVMRALEAAAVSGQREGVATEPIGPDTTLHVVDGLLTGIHSPQESHYRLLGALLDDAALVRTLELAASAGLRAHEFDDAALVIRSPGRRRH